MQNTPDIRESLSSGFLTLFEQSSEGILLVDAETGKIAEFNQRAQSLLGLSRDELLNKSFGELAGATGDKDTGLAIERLPEEPTDTQVECTLSGGLDTPLPVLLKQSRLDVGGNAMLLITFEDQSERFQVQKDMELLNIAIANVTTGVTIADAREADMPLVFINSGFEKLTGYTIEEVIGRNCRFLQGEECEQPGLNTLRKALKKGTGCTVCLRNFKKDGTLFYNELHLSPVRDRDGELTHFVGIQLDVTKEVLARESLERSERQTQIALEREAELSDMKSRFISMVSHEFRTPMTGMNASASLIRNFGDKLGKEKSKRHLQNIEISLKRMNRLLDDILFFSRAEADKIRVDRKPIQVNRYFDELVEHLLPIYPAREVRIESSLTDETAFLLDVHLLNHIFYNLIGNAFKYSPPDTDVVCAVHEADEMMTVEVIDRGIGIPDADREQLFEAFHRAGNVGARQGSGMGLNIAMRATELLNGKLTFVSRENEGSTFTVSLPVSPPN